MFDGYSNPTSTKTNAHALRSLVKCQEVVINESNTFDSTHSTQEKFLSNETNKTNIITLIAKYLEEDGQTVIKCGGDADTTIVSEAIKLAFPKRETPVMVVADDTDIAVMLLYHWSGEFSDIIFYSRKSQKAWSIDRGCIDLENKEHLLFVHAWSGCDTVSATYGKGKVSLLKLLNQSDELKDLSTAYSDVWADKEVIGQLSADVFRIVYAGRKHDTLTDLR